MTYRPPRPPHNSYPVECNSSQTRTLDRQTKQFEAIDLIPGEAAFRAYGSTLAELFRNAALALFSVMGDLKAIDPKQERIISLNDASVERLLLDFLSVLVYL